MARRLMLAAACCAALLVLPAAGASARTTWLCKPGLAHDPCASRHGTTVISPAGAPLGMLTPAKARPRKIDCFYVYPTVSDQKRIQATKRIDPEERSIALYQAARFSSECRIYAPMYRQITLRGLFLHPDQVTAKMRATELSDVRAAWREYLKTYNKGRGVVFIGHSQGSGELRQLLRHEVDAKPAVRRLMVSALLLGGNVLVKEGRDVGGDFRHLRACRSADQLHCVVAFSTFDQTPPQGTHFGVAGEGDLLIPGEDTADTEVLCTNPAALGGGSARLTSIYPSTPFAPATTLGSFMPQIGMPTPSVSTPWIQSRAYTGHCSAEGGANVLRIAGAPGAPALTPIPDASYGLHLVDANIALGDLVTLVHRQAARYAPRAGAGA